MPDVKIITPGLLTTVQDLGRIGGARFGVTVSGALDPDSLRLANALVGNAEETPGLELRYLGPEIEVVEGPVRMAIVGAGVAARVVRPEGEDTVGPDRTVTLSTGDRIVVGALKGSTTAILALSGGVVVPDVLGSASTLAVAGIGGVEGRALRPGDALPLGNQAPQGPDLALPQPYDLSVPTHIRVVPGPQDDRFTDQGWDTFLSTEWTVSQNADRMGLRLDGPEIEHSDGFNILSEGMVTGSIQVPGTARPIVLLADRGTSGGYPKIATVIGADLPALGRLGPGARLRFAKVTPGQGVAAARARHAEIQSMIQSIAPYHPEGDLDLAALYESELISRPEQPD